MQRGVRLKADMPEETVTSSVTVPFTSRQPDAAEGISVPLLTKMTSERTLAVQAALMQQPEKAVALMVWRMCTCVFSGCLTTTHPFRISLTVSHGSLTENAPSGKDGAAFNILMTERARLKALLPEGWEKDFTTFFALDGGVLMSLMAFCTGTSWGTFSIMMPIAVPMAVAMNGNILLTIGAVVSGGIFGDHCSPLSDTTILSSMSVGTDLYSHVKTQLPYALVTAVCTAALYIAFGLIL